MTFVVALGKSDSDMSMFNENKERSTGTHVDNSDALSPQRNLMTHMEVHEKKAELIDKLERLCITIPAVVFGGRVIITLIRSCTLRLMMSLAGEACTLAGFHKFLGRE